MCVVGLRCSATTAPTTGPYSPSARRILLCEAHSRYCVLRRKSTGTTGEPWRAAPKKKHGLADVALKSGLLMRLRARSTEGVDEAEMAPSATIAPWPKQASSTVDRPNPASGRGQRAGHA